MGIVGIDQGTTSTRALLMDERGVPELIHSVEHRQIYPQEGWVEHDPEELIRNIFECASACTNAIHRVGAIGIDNQGESCLAWDAVSKQALSPVIVWQDNRTVGAFEALKQSGFESETLARAGLPLDPYFSASKLAWIVEHGDFGTLYVDGQNIPVTASVVDQQAALYGFGCRKAGDTKMTFGTGAFALMVTGNNIVSKSAIGLLSTVAWQLEDQKPVYALDGGVYTASASLNWAKSLGLFNDFSQINSFKSSPAVHSGLVFVPALAGLACPHWSPRARGTWLGLSLEHTPQQLVQAILEGVAFRASEVISAMDEAMPMHNDILIDGGMSKNPYFVQFLSDVTQRTICRSSQSDTTALGTLMLASRVIGNELQPHNEYASVVPDAKADYPITKFRKAVAISKDWCDS